MIYFGSIVFALTLGSSILSVISAIASIRLRSERWLKLARTGFDLHLLLVGSATFALGWMLVSQDLSAIYVATHVNLALPVFYRLTSLWAGQAGSMLWWNFLLVIFSWIAIRGMRRKEPVLVPYMIAILGFCSFFFAALGNFSSDSDPFRQITAAGNPVPQPDGRGLNPLLQHWAMIIHPPILYFGYVSFAVPFAIAFSALLADRVNRQWTRLIRRWTVFSWFFLSTGILLGGKWAYEELGWGGYWAWDPVENASLMPWLSGTAFLHSIIVQEKRGMLKVWNMVLVALSFIMTMFGTFLTRSGIVKSVHAFAESDLGWYFGGFLALVLVFSAITIQYRLSSLKSDNPFHSFLSREAGFLFNNVLLMISLFTILWGTIYPAVTEAFTGQRVSVTATWFNRWMVPVGLGILFLTGCGPLLSWRSTSAAVLARNFRLPLAAGAVVFLIFSVWHRNDVDVPWVAGLTFSISAFVIAGVLEEIFRTVRARISYTAENPVWGTVATLFLNKRRYLGYMVHIGLAIMFIGFAGKAFSTEDRLELGKGESTTFAGHLIQVDAISEKEFRKNGVGVPLYFTRMVDFSVYKDSQLIGRDHTEIRTYPMYNLSRGNYSDSQNTSEPGIISGPLKDIYLQFAGLNSRGKAILQIWYNPLVFWLWGGFGIYFFFALMLLLPIGEGRVFRVAGRSWSIAPVPASQRAG